MSRTLFAELANIQQHSQQCDYHDYYLAQGTWDVMGNAPVRPMLGQPEDGRFELVAGGGFS